MWLFLAPVGRRWAGLGRAASSRAGAIISGWAAAAEERQQRNERAAAASHFLPNPKRTEKEGLAPRLGQLTRPAPQSIRCGQPAMFPPLCPSLPFALSGFRSVERRRQWRPLRARPQPIAGSTAAQNGQQGRGARYPLPLGFQGGPHWLWAVRLLGGKGGVVDWRRRRSSLLCGFFRHFRLCVGTPLVRSFLVSDLPTCP